MTEWDLQGSQQIHGKLRLKHNKGEYSPITMGGDEAWSPDEESGGGSTLDSPVWRRAGMQSTPPPPPHHHHQQQQQEQCWRKIQGTAGHSSECPQNSR